MTINCAGARTVYLLPVHETNPHQLLIMSQRTARPASWFVRLDCSAVYRCGPLA